MPAIANGQRHKVQIGLKASPDLVRREFQCHRTLAVLLKNCQPATIDINYLAVDIARCR
jgi:hypothetical protein